MIGDRSRHGAVHGSDAAAAVLQKLPAANAAANFIAVIQARNCCLLEASGGMQRMPEINGSGLPMRCAWTGDPKVPRRVVRHPTLPLRGPKEYRLLSPLSP